MLNDKDILPTGDKDGASERIKQYLSQNGPEKALQKYKNHKEVKNF